MDDAAAIEQLRRRGRFVELAAALAARPETPPAVDGPFRDGGPDRGELAAHLHDRGRTQWHLARFAEAERDLTRALAMREELLGPLDARTIDTRERLAAVYHYRVDDRAEPLFRQVVAQREAVHGAESAEAAVARRNLGALLRDRGDFAGAHALLEGAARQLARQLGKEHPEHAAALKALAFLLVEQLDGEDGRVEQAADDALAMTIRAHDLDHPFTGAARLLVARAHMRVKRLSAAARELARALAALRAGYGDDHPLVALARVEDGRIRFWQEDMVEALDHMRRGAELHARWYPDGGGAARIAYEVAIAASAAGRPDDARVWHGRAAAAVTGDPGAQHTLVDVMLAAARWAATSGDLDAARVLVDRARELDADERLWREHIHLTAAHIADLAGLMPG